MRRKTSKRSSQKVNDVEVQVSLLIADLRKKNYSFASLVFFLPWLDISRELVVVVETIVVCSVEMTQY